MGITFFNPVKNLRGAERRTWSNQEIADFYRAMDVLRQAGLDTSTDCGVTDEGDPWFVFLKSDSSDVIAHFARIDGEFIAVSALSNEVYRGKGIREIVDNMLERHPLLIPQRKEGGRLFLHPTAALTAFLAAAFILNIDGIKASNIAEIISASGASNSLTSADGLQQHLGNQRHEPAKLMFSDISSTSYNIAVLGAALIAHELSADLPDRDQDMTLEKYGNADNKIGNANFGETVDYRANDYQLDVDSNSERISMNLQMGDATANSKDAEQQVLKKEQENQGTQKVTNESGPASMGQPEGAEALVENKYSVDWGMRNLIENETYIADKSNVAVAQTVHEKVLAGQGTSAQENLAESSLENFQERKDNFSLDGFTGQAAAFADVIETEIVLSGFNDRQLFAFETSQLKGEITLYTPTPLSIFESDVSLAGTSNFGHRNSEKSEEVSLPDAQDQSPRTDLGPIVGHSFFNPDAALQMTEAIDVVFFKGGYAEIKGFELGKDLLWFFLPENVLAQSVNTITGQGDLTLDFGDTGSLKFLGVVQETVPETLV